ncbi:MAG: hypothetical protein M5U23_13875 [Acidimicrobiia bacterium]|nr:hypothetical protein [Acidimicrobiia bacterium]
MKTDTRVGIGKRDKLFKHLRTINMQPARSEVDPDSCERIGIVMVLNELLGMVEHITHLLTDLVGDLPRVFDQASSIRARHGKRTPTSIAAAIIDSRYESDCPPGKT